MAATTPQPSGLVDRHREREQVDRLVADVRAGRSRVLVLRGEAGVGKTALLKYLLDGTSGCQVARAAGVESEMELAFAGLHQLCAPMLGRIDGLPGPQRDALSTAFGLGTGKPPDRFLVGLAVLGLLAEVAETKPLVCVVDDAQWLDRESVQTLAFVARRLLAERVAFVFALRADDDQHALAGLPELVVEGLEHADARTLLEATIPGPLDHRVRDRILAEAHGNPLALLELPRGQPPAAVAGGFGLPSGIPLAARIEQGFVRRLAPLPVETRRLLLAAAAEPVGDVALLWRAADRLEIAPDAVAPAEAAGLVELGVRVRFRHPLVRSSVYRSASPEEKRAVHRVLADVTDAEIDPDRRAWHRAHAVVGADEAVAAELERSAGRARGRGGVAAAAAFLQRAAELTPDPAVRGARALAAAQAKFESASPEAALGLLEVAEMCPLDDLQRARHARLRAEIVFAQRRGRDAPPLLLAAAGQLAALDPALARETYVEALGAAMYAGRCSSGSGVHEAAAAARNAPPAPQPPRSIDLVLDGMATRFSEGPGAGVAPLRLAVEAFRNEVLDGHEATMRWLMLCPVVQSLVVFELWDDDAFHALATRAVRLARDTGALTMLPVTLPYLAGVHLFSGEYATAAALNHEADTITAATGNAALVYAWILLGAWRGAPAEALEVIEAGVESATARGEGRVLALAGYASSVLYNGLGRHEESIEGAQRGAEDDDQGYAGGSLAELVEAATRVGRPDLAAAALRRLDVRARAAGTDWALGMLARARALTSEGAAAEELYREAIERLERTRMHVELARARLVYGEWLRREQRRADAREQLRVAHDRFVAIGAEAFADRARRELTALGETVRKRIPEIRVELTPQESQIARLAADGQTNPEIGAQLFISPRTVEYHLRKVFDKLSISSRKDLRTALPELAPAGIGS
ncbi:AAA family ATPase [Conexibacter stalactiti]|uniref:AAA family ATPase n=1 Tax=Conexibacter stalactiti TaxID=1940611 RepID=A0ABU4HNF1_9ACTN|nr:AAA family ATPase [Conexibacter stalactiti]MDW5594239.1 AAA family ATPase [Conexibacter stalactiti]MEC5034881.1 AAA family ATPase [Conexibacter stalactiti]